MKYLLSVPLFFTTLLFYMFAYSKAVKVEEHHLVLDIPKELKPLRLFFISDIHRRNVSERLLSKLPGKFDAVIIGGDLAEKGVPLLRISKNIRNLSTKGPIYYVWGNNDREVGEANIRDMIEGSGGMILENDSSLLYEGRNRWIICAVDDASSGLLDIDRAFSKVLPSDVKIFITHSPFVFKKTKAKYNPHVMMAGHTHGGQIRIGKLGPFRKGKLSEEDGRFSLVSNGFGTSIVPLRLGARPQCHIINIYGKNE